jgi:hypothetical protein
VGKPEGKRCRWEDIIKTDIRNIGWGGMDWIDLAQDRDQWKADLNVKFLSSCAIGGFSRRWLLVN